ncbi:hypothetical protein LY78DRAFT_70401 [Colletotrichum sublineola]|nr:hypothetical protein LY78DRAFT_70401 [Colletotrichum sublineola]
MANTMLSVITMAEGRAIVSKGWSDLGDSKSESVYRIGECLYQGLFQYGAAVV